MVTVVIPSYKRPEKLNKLLKSIIEQTVLPNEIIVVDDCSDMDLEYKNVIYKNKINFKKLKYIKNESNFGAPKSRNIGIKNSSSEWIALTDDDDIWLKNKLELQTDKKFLNNEKIGIISCWSFNEKDNNRKIFNYFPKSYYPIKNILETNFIPSPSPIIRKQALIKAGLFDESLYSCQDWDMWVRVFNLNYDYVIIKKPLVVHFDDNLDSIGQSKLARVGYRQFLIKHYVLILKKTSFLNWIKKIITFFSTYL